MTFMAIQHKNVAHCMSGIESLEPRLLFANLMADEIYLIDRNTRQRVTDPAPGTQVYIRGVFTATGVAPGTTVRLHRKIQNSTVYKDLPAETSWQQQATVDQNLYNWTVPPGVSKVSFILDPERKIAETAEDDNTFEFTIDAGSYTPAAIAPPPSLHSLPDAQYGLYLDFDGHFTAKFSRYSRVTTPVYDSDGDPTSFSETETAAIREVWQRVSEDFAPFNIDVTTEAPSAGRYKKFQRVCIGGDNADWALAGRAAGIAALRGFNAKDDPEPAYVFLGDFSDGPVYAPANLAEAASHEAGHAFGLDHQSKYNSAGELTDEYHRGSGDWSPLMGSGYRAISTWHNGPTPKGSATVQDDLAVLSGTANGFGYRPDDVPGAIAAARNLGPLDSPLSFSGLIGRNDDVDAFSFNVTKHTTGKLEVLVAKVGPNLDTILELRSATGILIQTSDPTDQTDARLTADLSPGTYFAIVKNNGVYGRLGHYVLNVTGAAAEIEVTTDGAGDPLQSSGEQGIDFGVVPQYSDGPRRTFLVRNRGDAQLTLQPPLLPPGFTLDEPLAESLEPGATDSFSVRMETTAAGSFSGRIIVFSNDADEASFGVPLTGNVTTFGPNLTATALAGALPSSAIAGAKVKVKGLAVSVANTGNAAAIGKVVVTLVLSQDLFVGADDVAVGKPSNQPLKLQPQQSKRYGVRLTSLPIVPDGDYFLLAHMNTSTTVVETDPSDNVAATATSIRVVRPFINLVNAWDGNLASILTRGQKSQLSLPVRNDGNSMAKGLVNVHVLASADRLLDDGDALWAKRSIKLSLKAGSRKILRYTFSRLTHSAPSYYLIVVLVPELSLVEGNSTDNVAVAQSLSV